MQTSKGLRTIVFKNRGLLLVPVALVLVVFGRPTVASAIVGIAVAALGELLRVWAVGYSGTTTRADIVTAPTLVTGGPYSFVRNPLYVGNAITALGFWLAFSGDVPIIQSLLMLAFIVLMVGGVYTMIIPLEEAYLTETFGAPYREYVAQVPSIIPVRGRLPRAQRLGRWHSEVIFRAEMITLIFFAIMIAAVIARLYATGKPGL